MSDKYCVPIEYFWPDYWENFLHHCNDIAESKGWTVYSVIDHQLKPHGKLIRSKTRGAYLRWNHKKFHTAFLLRWA
jgi:hypothetical protein